MQDETGKLPTPDSHVDGKNGAKTMVYNMKRNSKKGGLLGLCGLVGPGSILVLGSKPKLVLTLANISEKKNLSNVFKLKSVTTYHI